MPKPGPLSSKTKNNLNAGSFGEDSTSVSTDANEISSGSETEKENRENRRSPRRSTRISTTNDDSRPDQTLADSRLRNSRAAFRSPDNESNVTDYGFEFTHSRMRNESPRRCSTMNQQPEEDQPSTSRQAAERLKKDAAKPKEKPTVKPTKPKATKQTPLVSNNAENASNAPPKKRRKQKHPLSNEQHVLREIKKLQHRTDFLIPRMPFSRVVAEIMRDESNEELTRITRPALEALQTAAEMYLTQRIADAYMLTLHRGRVTLEARDLQLLLVLKANI